MYLDNEFDYNHDGQLDSWEQADRDQTLYEMQLPRKERTLEFSRMIDDRGLGSIYGEKTSLCDRTDNAESEKLYRRAGVYGYDRGVRIFICILITIIAFIVMAVNSR